jgi:hypothetical protein
MSIEMDSQDLRGYLRGVCLIVVVRNRGCSVGRADIERTLGGRFLADIDALVGALAAFTGVSQPFLRGGVLELFQANDEFLLPDNLNLQLGLLSGRPAPIFPFVEEGQVHQLALLRPFLDVARNLVHAAVRLRMQLLPPSPANAFWPAVATFLHRVGGDDELAEAIALSTIADVVSDIIFFNLDAATRTDDPELVARMGRVIEELGMTDLHAIARTRRGR